MQSDDVNTKGIVIFLGILVVTLGIFYASVTAMWHRFERHAQRIDVQLLSQKPSVALAAGQPYFPEPREQTNAAADLEALRARENADLTTYGWIDKSNGVVRIPIDRAIELLTTKEQP